MKRIHIFMLISLILISCNSVNDTSETDQGPVHFDPFPLEVPEHNALMTKWEQKEVIKSRLIDDFETENDHKPQY